MSTTISKRRETTLALIKAYESMDMDRIMSFRTHDCITAIVPSSIGREPFDNTSYRTFFSAIAPHIKNFRITIIDLVEDTAANKVVVYASSVADTVKGPDTYGNQYFLLFEFDEEGGKIKKMTEFVDSKKSMEQRNALYVV